MAKARVHQETSPFIVTTFLLLVVVGWLVGLVPSLIFAAQQLATNPNLSAYYTTFLYELFLPLVVFFGFMAYRRRKTGWPLVIESMLLTLIVWLVATSVSGLSRFVISQLHIVLAGDLGWWYFELIVCSVSAIAVIVVLLYARKLGKW